MFIKWKSNLILCLLHRATVICSSKSLFDREVSKLRSLFMQNSYPGWFFDKITHQFLSDQSVSSTQQSQPISQTQAPERKRDFSNCFAVPFLGKMSRVFVSRLSRLIKQKYNVDVTVFYKTFKVGTYFQLKPSTPASLLSNVVYQFTCSRDVRATYIGMSNRHLVTRAQEHLNLGGSVETAISQHIRNCHDCLHSPLDTNSFKIIKKCKDNYETKIQEALMIKKHNPSINKQLYASGCSFLLNVY